jgi:hypothetical protein
MTQYIFARPGCTRSRGIDCSRNDGNLHDLTQQHQYQHPELYPIHTDNTSTCSQAGDLRYAKKECDHLWISPDIHHTSMAGLTEAADIQGTGDESNYLCCTAVLPIFHKHNICS